jgi:hypothetical protein
MNGPSSTSVGIFWIVLAAVPLAVGYWGRDTLGISLGLSLLAFVMADGMIPKVGAMLKDAGRCGKDLNKPGQPAM